MLAVALYLASRGWRVIPLRPREKRPLTRHGCHDGTTDRDQIVSWWRRWPQANIGVTTGAGSDLVVVDVDGPAGWIAWARLCAEHGEPSTLVQRTGRLDGGRQLFFRHPGGVVGNRARLGGCGYIQVRADGGYVVVAPSVHPSGRRYRWITHGEPAKAPGWLLRLIRPPDQPRMPHGTVRRTAPAGRYGRVALERACSEQAVEGRGQRAVELYRRARRLAELALAGELGEGDIEAPLVAAGVACGLSEREAARQVRCGLRDAGISSGG